MKAHVYAVRRDGEWMAWMTLAPDVDYAYWFDERYAKTASECGWFWCEELPLGQAAEAVERWKERSTRMDRLASVGGRITSLWDSGHGESKIDGGSMERDALSGAGRGSAFGGGAYRGASSRDGKRRVMTEGEAVKLMARCIEEAKGAVPRAGLLSWMGWRNRAFAERGAGSAYGKGMSKEAEGEDIGMGDREMAGRRGDEGVLGLAEAASGRGDEAGTAEPFMRRRSVVRWSAEGGLGAMDADRWNHAAAMAKLAATLLQGRALLSGEARALLSSATVPGAEEANWREAFQLAALLGQVRLGGAVAAPVGKRADARRRLRCQRCGSREAQLRRAACLACGRECAYCEACILMGRSRECELLVRGVYDSPVWKEHGLGRWKAMRKRNTKDRLGKWGLSPAQRDATAKALDYLEERPTMRQNKRSALAQKLKTTVQSAFSSRFKSPGSYADKKKDSRREDRRDTVVDTIANRDANEREDGGVCGVRIVQAQKPREGVGAAPRPFLQASGQEQLDMRSAPDRRFLIWAVTGAGKTEMVFPLVESVVNRGGRACIASPRRDVVLELDPRIRKAFPGASVVTLYGGSEQRWDRGEITLSTTHQLIRFHEAFDLIIIDELDAYPYHGNPMLYFAADKCRLRGAPTLLLSATPPTDLQRAARRGRLAHARVPVRYHRHPLPVPKLLGSPSVRKLLAKGRLPRSLMQALQQSLGRGAQVFLFVQQISESEPMAALLRKQWPALAIEATSSQDPDRADKVTRFRSAATRLLVTTTILERGVTIPRSDVFILDADGQLFDEASLVQMAGRAGRSADDPAGRVYFVAIARTLSQLKAVSHIKGMNRTAAKHGFLLPKPQAGRKNEP